MKEELTREVLEAMGQCLNYEECGICPKIYMAIPKLSTALLAEMDKPKVWDGAPEWATDAYIQWSAKTHYSGVFKSYTRELPKSRERQIAEEYAKMAVIHGDELSDSYITEYIEKAILKYKAELEDGR